MINVIQGFLGGVGSVLVALALLFVVIQLALRIPALRRFVLFAINLVPAGVLALVGVVALPFWKLADVIVGMLLKVLPVDTLFIRTVDRVSQWRLSSVADPVQADVLTGMRRKAAEKLWPERRFPDLYREVPDDVARPPYDDGRLLAGVRVHWLADRYLTEAALRSAVRIGLTATLLAFAAFTIIYLLSAVGSIHQAFQAVGGAEGLRVEQWPGQEPTAPPRSWIWAASASVVGPTLLRALGNLATFLPGCALASLGIGLLTTLLMLGTRQREKAAPYEWQTKDADVRWSYRTETRNLIRSTFARQVVHATDYLRGKPLFLVGRGTGTLRARGDLTGPVPEQAIRLDEESLFQHLLVFGGTGEGKTTAMLKPLARQFLKQPGYGMYVCDAKGVLWADMLTLIREVRPDAKVITIGTGAPHAGVDLLAGLTPTQVAGTLRSVLTQLSGGDGGGDSFWPDMAANVLRNVLSLGQAYGFTERGQGVFARDGMAPYSLWWAYQAVLRPELLTEAADAIREFHSSAADRARTLQRGSPEYQLLKRTYDAVTTQEVYDSIRYLEHTWASMARETRSGIVANVTQLLDGFAGTPVLRERFASGNPANTVSIAEALHGHVVLNALSSVEDGLPARLVSVLLKTNLYREARRREAAYRQGTSSVKPQSQPCIVLMDEIQELVTADASSGLSDATFWNVARSTGVAGVFATQTVAALMQAIGKDAATNFMQQARSKIFFRTEDQDTVEYACWCAGKFERNRVYDDGQRESIEYRGLIDGWDPLLPVDDSEGIAGGWRTFFRAAGALLNPEKYAIAPAQSARAYAADETFVPRAGGSEAADLAQISAMQQAAWRAEDLEREYRKTGNEVTDALTPADLIHMGRWHAFAQVQRAGAVRQDIIAVDHDFA